MLFRNAALTILALAVPTSTFMTSQAPAFARKACPAMSTAEPETESETEFDKSLKADIRKEVRNEEEARWDSQSLNRIYNVFVQCSQ